MAFATDLSGPDAFATEILKSPGQGVLQVLEVYSDWAGPCKAVTSTLKSLYFSFSDRPIKFLTLNSDKVKSERVDQYRGKCTPVFLLFKNGALKQSIVGVQGPALVESIVRLSDPATNAASGSE